MNKKLDDLLYDALLPEYEPDPELNRRILESRSKEASMMKHYHFKKMAAAVAVCVLTVGSITVYAAYKYLSPSQIAQEVSDNNALAKAFESEDAVIVNETQTSGDYEVTLLGLVSGTDLAPCVDEGQTGELEDSRTYAALAVNRIDGKRVTDDDKKCLSPLLNGVDWMVANNGTMDVTLRWFIEDRVIYELLDCDNLEIFAGRGVQVGVVDEFCDETEAFSMDENTGAYSKKDGYAGTNALFELPLDRAKADEKAADTYIEKLKKSFDDGGDDEADDDEAVGDADYEKYISDFDAADNEAEFLKANAVLVSTETLTVKKDDRVDFGNEDGDSGTVLVSGYEEGIPTCGMITGGTLDDTLIHMFTLNSDGTVMHEVYAPDIR